MAEYICIREEIVHKIPDDVSMEEAALSEPAFVALHAVFDCGSVLPGDTVAVFGPGAIGSIVAQLAKSCGSKVILVGISSDEKRLTLG